MESHQPFVGSDPLICFLRDIAELPVITGKSAYLLLTRRVERARVLKRINIENPIQRLQRIRGVLNKMLKEFNYACEQKNLPSLSVEILYKDFETFFNDSNIRTPATLGKYIPKQKQGDNFERLSEIIWRGLYLSSLLPQTFRDNSSDIPTEDELTVFFDQIVEDGKEAKKTLVEGTLRYVLKVARLYLHTGIPYLDLVQEGCVGLMRSVDTFSEQLGSHFQSHAVTWIRQRISRCIADYSRLIRVPVHQQDEIEAIQQKYDEFIEQTGYPPLDYELFIALGWLTEDEINLIKSISIYENALQKIKNRFEKGNLVIPIVESKDNIPLDMINLFYEITLITREEYILIKAYVEQSFDNQRTRRIHEKLKKAYKDLGYFVIATATHHSLESVKLPSLGEDISAEDLLMAEHAVEEEVFHNFILDNIITSLRQLSERERLVILLRFGLYDGKEKTLEEVGQILSVTRERIRQIENNVLMKLSKSSVLYNLKDFVGYQLNRLANESIKLQANFSQILESTRYIPVETDKEKKRLEQLMEKYIMGGRKRFTGIRKSGERAQVYKYILENENHPLHHSEIHKRSLTILPIHLHPSTTNAYATLFQNNWFRPFGNGVFGLSNWENVANNGSSEHVFIHCPTPLLPESPQPRAFFESVMIGYDLIQKHRAISAKDFYTKMLEWAKKASLNVQDAQNAFDVWYTCGLLERVDFIRDSNAPLKPTFTTDTRLQDIRLFCLNNLCRRILKMPELLLALERITTPTVSALQRTIFGGENTGFDIPIRLTILMAFEAVSFTGSMWRITDLGRLVLQANPPIDLPDFDAIEPDGEEASIELEDEFGLLDLY